MEHQLLLPGRSVEVFSALDDDQVGGGVDPPSQCRGGHQNLDLAGHEKALTGGAV